MMAHEKRRLELDVCHFSLLAKQYETVIQDLWAQLNEEESVKRRALEKCRMLQCILTHTWTSRKGEAKFLERDIMTCSLPCSVTFEESIMVTAGHQNEPIPTILLRLKPGEG
eukprot:Em0118g13a